MNHSIRLNLSPICRDWKRKLLAALVLVPLSHVVAERPYSVAPWEIQPIEAPFAMPQLERPQIAQRVYRIDHYGAKPMSESPEHKNTAAIHAAIEAAAAAGGGRVVVPAGDWLTGPVHLMSNIELHIAEGAVLHFSKDLEDYLPVVLQRHEGVEALNYSPLIYAFELENVAVTGSGRLNGNGDHWWAWYRQFGAHDRVAAAKQPLSRRHFGKGAGKEGMRPNFMVFWKCRNVLVEGVTLDDTPMWNVHLIYTENAIVRDVTINSLRAPNGDGVVVDSSRNVLVEYNHFETGDDAVVIKSGINEDGLAINIPTENVVVRYFTAADVRTGSGGVVFGSETSGGIRNVYVHDAFFDESDRGIRFKTERGRGNVTENIYVRNIRMKNIRMEAINFNSFYSGPRRTGPSPLMRNIFISDIDIDGVPNGISLIGLPEKWLENVVLENVSVRNAKRGARFNQVKNLQLRNVSIESEETAMVLNNVFEVILDGVTLSDATGGKTLHIGGGTVGALNLGSIPADQVQLGEGVDAAVLTDVYQP